jgi:hypothetical protein
VTKEMRDTLKGLSTKLYGKSSRWRKMLDRGYLDQPKGDEKFTKEGNPFQGRVRRQYTPETLLAKLQELSVAQDQK